MTIKREDLDRQAVNFSEIATGRLLPPVHPSEILRDDFLLPLGLSVYRIARAMKIPRPRLNDLVRGRRGFSVDTALRLGRFFGTTPEFWMNFQTRYDLDVVGRTPRPEIEREIEPYAADPAPRSVGRAPERREQGRLAETIADFEANDTSTVFSPKQVQGFR